ncbi:MAG: hypothetical protein E4H38_07465 [Gemmatimonadales bacterium]|nr:MAG: hypothetical protein E4H38_07465 [Gemmatimonadales bacterium]
MRANRLLVLLCVLLPALAPGRSTAQQRPRPWELHVSLGRDAFGGASLDSVTVPSVPVEVTPAPHLAFEAGASRAFGAWEVGVSAGYASGNLRARTDRVVLDDRSGGVVRYRLGLILARRIVSVAPASVHALVGPVLDRWETADLGGRTVAGARMGASLRFALGRVSVENALLFAVGGSPFDQRALPAGVILRPLTTWSVGVGLRYGL